VINVRALAETDLAHTLEGEFRIPVVLIDPTGLKIDKTKNGLSLGGRVLLSQPRTNMDTGEVVIVPDPVVELRRSSLSRVPVIGEKWGVIIPDSPRADAVLETYVLDPSRTVSGGESLGVIKLPLVKATQAEIE